MYKNIIFSYHTGIDIYNSIIYIKCSKTYKACVVNETYVLILAAENVIRDQILVAGGLSKFK